jgi:hypothetical protein
LVHLEEASMSTIGFVGPVKDVGAMRAFASEVNGPRKADYLAAQKRNGCVRERVFLTETPMGPMVMVYREAPNAGMTMATVAASSNAYDKYYFESVTKMAGVDFSKLPPGPPPHLVFEWASGKRAKGCTMIGAPVPDASKLWKMCREMSRRQSEHRESRERQGFVLEQAFYLHEAKMVAAYLEGDDPQAAMERGLKSDAPYDKWFAEQLAEVHGIDFRAHAPPKTELLVSFDA